MVIDVHAHYYPPEYTRRVTTEGAARAPSLARAPLAGLGIEQQREVMERCGIDLQVLSVGLLQPYAADREVAVGLARLANDVYAEACAAHRGHFLAVAALPLPHVDACLAECGRCLDELGMVGVTLGCSFLGHEMDDPLLAPLYEELDRRGSVVLLHPLMQPPVGGLTELDLDRSVGGVLEDTLAALRLVASGVVASYPRIRFVVPHLGGTIPFLLGRLSRHGATRWPGAPEGRGAATAPSQPLAAGLSRLWYDTAVAHRPALRCTWESFGADRLVLGTDYPYVDEEHLAERVRAVRQAGLPEGDAQRILGASAGDLLGGSAARLISRSPESPTA